MTFAPLACEVDYLIYWVEEREAVRRAKAAGRPKPWSKDPLFCDFRWCNVSRSDDKVTVDLFKQWYAPADPATQLVAATLGRLFNWPETLLEATGGRSFAMAALPGMRNAIHARAQRGCKIFTGAYLVPGVPGQTKIDSILDLAAKVAERSSDVLRTTLRDTWAELIKFDGIGSFLAGQITADMAHLHVGNAWPDRITWAPVGPGSARGINRLLGRPKDKPVSQDQFDIELQQFIKFMRPRIQQIDADRALGAIDFQSLLCEYDKGRRLKLGQGTVRARYPGRGESQASLEF